MPSIRFLGIIINSVTLELTLPRDKLEKLISKLESFSERRKATKKDLERLGGLLAHCAKVVRGGRTFSRRIYDLMGSVKKSYYKVRLNAGFREDVNWWLQFAKVFNGTSQMLGKFAPTHSVYTDASCWGFGALYGRDWLAGTFAEEDSTDLAGYLHHHNSIAPGSLLGSHINTLEMWAVFAAASKWVGTWRNAKILVMTDNTTVLAALCTGRSRSQPLMPILRKLFWYSVEYNFTLSAAYVRSRDNVVCDCLSRLNNDTSNNRLLHAKVLDNICCGHTLTHSFSNFRKQTSGRAEGIPGHGLLP